MLAADPPALADYSALSAQLQSQRHIQSLSRLTGDSRSHDALRATGWCFPSFIPKTSRICGAGAHGKPGVAVHRRDAYEAIKAFLPPAENRGLIVVDPPYEVTDEYERVAKAVVAGHRRWPGGRWMIWHTGQGTRAYLAGWKTR